MKNVITWESIIKKLGFDPREGLKYEPNENDWAIDDSKPNPYSVLSEEESQFLEDNWFGPQVRRAKKRSETRQKRSEDYKKHSKHNSL